VPRNLNLAALNDVYAALGRADYLAAWSVWDTLGPATRERARERARQRVIAVIPDEVD
jgi:hypothetical protein